MDAQYMHAGRYTCHVESPLGDNFEVSADVNVNGEYSSLWYYSHIHIFPV